MIARVVRKKTTKLAATDEGADVTASNRRRDPHRWSVPRIVKVLEKEMVGAEITGLHRAIGHGDNATSIDDKRRTRC